MDTVARGGWVGGRAYMVVVLMSNVSHSDQINRGSKGSVALGAASVLSDFHRLAEPYNMPA